MRVLSFDKRIFFLSLLIGLGMDGTCNAQSLPDPNPELKRQQAQLEALRARQELAPDVMPAPNQADARRLPQVESPCFTIREVQVLLERSPELMPAREEQALLDIASAALAGKARDDTPLGKCLGAEGVNLLLKRAQDALVARGYVTSRVLATPQDMASGSLRLSVIPGRVHAVVFAAQSPSANPRATTINTVPTDVDHILNLRDIEQGLENFKRVPTVEVDIQITPAPSGAPDQSDLVISYQQQFPLRVALNANDSGSPTTGKYQGSATLSWDNPLGLSDLFYITLSHDLGNGQSSSGTGLDDQGTKGSTVHYSLPFGYWLLSATYSASNYFQSVPGATRSYIYSGTSETSELKLSRMLWRDAVAKTLASLAAWQRKSNNYIEDTEVGVQRRVVGGFQLDVNHKRFFGDTTLDINFSYKRGTGDFGTLSAPEELFDEGYSRFGMATLSANLAAPFSALSTKWRYDGALKVQDNFNPLTPQDRLSIGSRYSVRGFDGESGLIGDRGWSLRNDLNWLFQDNTELYFGLDAGEVGGPSNASALGNSLAGSVIGLRGSVKPGGAIWRNSTLQYDFFAGGPLSKPQGFKTADTTLGFSLNLSF